MSLELVSPKDGLIAAIASRLRPDGKDYSRSWVVFPEKRPAYYLRKALAEKEKTGFVPPRLDSIESFVDRVASERLGLRDRPIDVLDAVAVLFDLHRSAPDRLGRDHFISEDHFFPLGVKLFNDLEELAAAAVRKDDLLMLDAWEDEAVPRETLNRLQSLSFFYDRFYETLMEKGFSTPSSRFREVAGRIRPELFPDVDRFIFAGFFSLTKTEAALLKMMLDWESFTLCLLKGKGIESILDLLGVKDAAARKALENPDPDPPLEFVKSPDTHGQIFALNRVLEDGLRAPDRLHEKQVIVLPAAETLFPLYQQTLAGLPEEAFNVSMGYPLRRTPIYSFFDKLLELLESVDEEGRIYIPRYLRFVLHPYTKNIYFPAAPRRADLTRILFHAVEEELTRRRTKAFWSLEELETDEDVRKSIWERVKNMENAPLAGELVEHLRSVHDALLAPFAEIRNVGDFAEKLSRVLNYVYDSSTARLHYFFHPYAEAFLSRLDALARSLLRDVSFRDKGSYFNLFRKVVASGSVPFFGTPLRGLQVLGFWETRGIPFEDVFILDMNEDVIPSTRREDSLLPFGARKAFGLPTHEDLERRMEYVLDTLVKAARKVHFFFVENSDKERSRFIEKLIWERQKRDGEPRAGKYFRTIEYRLALQTGKPDPVAKTAEVVETLRRFCYSTTSLDTYLDCPLRFYYYYVLNIRRKEEVTERLEKKDVGTFVHSILEEYFLPFEGKRVCAGDLSVAAMNDLVERRFAALYGRELAGSPYLIKLQVRRHLEEFINGYQIPVVRDLEERGMMLRILSLERRLEVDWTAGGNSFRLAAKIDRTEMRGDDLFILDYKTSANEKYLGIAFRKLDADDRGTWNKAVRSLQLPLYAQICSLVHGKPADDVHGRFLMLGKSRLSRRIECSPFSEDDTAVRRGELRTMHDLIRRILGEIVDPDVPFDPGLNREESCGRCEYATICDRR